jgi:hypothetical protein
MKEMDPSEELLMEREMMEDEDLLIEVESMRQTLQKLDQLPEVDPPSHVIDSVKEKAAEQAQQNRANNNSYRKPAFKYAVAATLALTLTAGGAWFFVNSEISNPQQQEKTVASSTSEGASPNTAGAQLTGQQQVQTVSTASSSESNVQPWVDRNNILRFEDQFSNQNEQFRAILKQSIEKLQLIDNSAVRNDRVNSIQLTGSGN